MELGEENTELDGPWVYKVKKEEWKTLLENAVYHHLVENTTTGFLTYIYLWLILWTVVT